MLKVSAVIPVIQQRPLLSPNSIQRSPQDSKIPYQILNVFSRLPRPTILLDSPGPAEHSSESSVQLLTDTTIRRARPSNSSGKILGEEPPGGIVELVELLGTAVVDYLVNIEKALRPQHDAGSIVEPTKGLGGESGGLLVSGKRRKLGTVIPVIQQRRLLCPIRVEATRVEGE